MENAVGQADRDHLLLKAARNKMHITFDNSLEEFAKALIAAGIDLSPENGIAIRDTRGRLSFISRRPIPKEAELKVSASINEQLLPYVSPIGPIADLSSPGASTALGDSPTLKINLKLGAGRETIINLLDRRAVGADWLHIPIGGEDGPPKLTFASLKGGVGRSTALSVLAAELADRGHSVLVVDLDLEAPGLGSMLIEPDAVPKFGTLDFFVEVPIQGVEDSFLLDCTAPSWLGGGRGRIDVAPSFGATSMDSPSNVLAKLARAYLESANASEEGQTFLGRAQELVRRLTSVNRYDAVLIDARAGLHETTAAAILGLGADVLLFGVDQPQTIIGYKVLLSHLAQLPSPIGEDDWRYRLRMIQAKTLPEEKLLASYRDKMFDLFDTSLYDEETSLDDKGILDDTFRFSVDDTDAPHFAIPIYDDDRYRFFDPINERTQLTRDFYSQSFSQFINFCLDRLQMDEDSET